MGYRLGISRGAASRKRMCATEVEEVACILAEEVSG